jgi:hypothetical protein
MKGTKVKKEIILPSKFIDIARRCGLRPEYLAEVICEAFGNNPPEEIRVVKGDTVERFAC